MPPIWHLGVPLWHSEHPGGRWEQQSGHEGVQNRISSDMGMIFKFCSESFMGIDSWSVNFILGFVPAESKLGRLGLLKPRFRKEGLAVKIFP